MEKAITPPNSVDARSFYDSFPVSTVDPDRLNGSVLSDDERPMNSPSDNASFHTADSMESSLTEVDGSISNYDSGEDDQQDHTISAHHQTFDLPPGYESQVKLEVVDSYEPLADHKRIPDDSFTERLKGHRGSEPSGPVRKPSIDLPPSESTPLLIDGSNLSDSTEGKKEECNDCCIIL